MNVDIIIRKIVGVINLILVLLDILRRSIDIVVSGLVSI